MIKLYTSPTPLECSRNSNNGISQVVLALNAHLPKHGYEFVEDINAADLLVSNAGSLAGIATPQISLHHGLYPTAMQPFDGTFHEINQRVLQDDLVAKAVICPSDWTAETLRRDLHINPHVCQWGVNLKEWKHNYQHEGYVLWAKARNTDVCTTDWINRLAETAHEIQFVSTFSDLSYENIKTIGRVDHDTMKEYIKRAGVYLATTRETGDIAAREALAAGVPVLGFNHAATAEFVVHGYNGFLAEPGDFEGLLNGLYYCLRNRNALSKNALQSAKAFGWQHTAKKIAGIFDSVVNMNVGSYKAAIVIPVYNYQEYVEQTIDSALAQETTFNYEIIIVDDGSTDDSLEVIKRKVEGKYDHVRFITQPNQGVGNARNNGIRLANAEYIVCLDADDLIAPNFLQVCVEALDRNLLAGIAYTRLQVIDWGLSAWLEGSFNYEAQTQRQNQVPTCCCFRKEAWQRAGGYRQNKFPTEDADLWLRITSLGYTAIKASDQPLFHYRQHERSATATIRAGFASEPNWTSGKGWIASNQFPALAGGKVRPVRDYDKPDVSIIIPVGKGHEQLLHDALDSVEGQSHPFWECIVINDSGSELDLTAYPYVKQHYTPAPGSGASVARNIGIKAAKGKFCVFLDADDYLNPEFIARTMREYRQSGQYVYTDWTMHTLQGEIEVHTAPDFHPDLIFQKGFYHAITCLVPTKWLREVGGFDETLRAFEDWQLFIELQIRGYCGKRLATPLFGYRYTTGTLRELGLDNQETLKALMYARYKPYMDGEKQPMGCNCNNLKPPILDGVPEQDLIRVVYRSNMGAKHPVVGSKNYGSHKDGDTFYIFARDLDMQSRNGYFETIPEVIEESVTTLIPPELESA